ncbi:MAG: flagellar basal body rod protein FlgB, partial [Mariprofundaceae bacterium]
MTVDLFGQHFRLMESALVAREQAQGVHAANIANADTPNYRADRRSFADFLQQRLHQSAGGMTPLRTHPGHLDGASTGARAMTPMHALIEDGMSRRMDGNTVDV